MEEYGIESEPTQVAGISRFVENNNEIQWGDSHILGSTLPRNSSTSSAFRRPMLGNTKLHKAAWHGNDDYVVKLVLDKCPSIEDLKGLSPVEAAIVNRDKAMLILILEKMPERIHLTDQNGRIPLHYAAFKGFLEGVRLIINKCKCCAFRSDKDGYFPIHLATYGGHVKVVKELLNYCNNPAEMLDNDHCNILHMAAKFGNHAVVHYILNNTNDFEMINQKNYYGNTPLHYATTCCHPKTVYYFTWNDRVDLNSVNFDNQTPLDIISTVYQLKGNPSIIKTGPISPHQLEKGSVC